MILVLSSLEATAALAKVFADCVTGSPSLPPVLLRGQLGAGKTTFIRELVQSGLVALGRGSRSLTERAKISKTRTDHN